jgi:hypothetical protein
MLQNHEQCILVLHQELEQLAIELESEGSKQQ